MPSQAFSRRTRGRTTSAVRDAEAHLKPGKRHAVNALRIALVVRPRVLRENGMAFAGLEVRFRVADGAVYVVEVTEERDG